VITEKFDGSVSDYLYFLELDTEVWAAWNRYFPTLFIMNQPARDVLDAIRRGDAFEMDDETRAFLQELIKFKFIFPGKIDPSKSDFIALIDDFTTQTTASMNRFCLEGQGYDGIGILNDECNLGCPYCIARTENTPGKRDNSARLELMLEVLGQYMSRQSSENPTAVSFCGGEILLEWRLIKKAVAWLKLNYPQHRFNFQMNTNLTLMTDEIAMFMAEHEFQLHISIDGSDRSHDNTRKYVNGKGTFNDVLKGLEIYRKYNKADALQSYQGTLDLVENFSPADVYNMGKYGFHSARLAPNLLNTSIADAEHKADIMQSFLELNRENEFQVKELFFMNARNRVNLDDYRFSFFCNGLSGLPRVNLKVNLSTSRLSLLCDYIGEASVSFAETGSDIHSPLLQNRATDYVMRRATALKEHCMSCHLVGLCRGGCIYNGLDESNKRNEAACTYQTNLWAHYIKDVYHNQSEADPNSL